MNRFASVFVGKFGIGGSCPMLLAVLLGLASGCGDEMPENSAALSVSKPAFTNGEKTPLPADAATTVSKLRTYCRACHGVGSLRFIHSDDDQAVWTYIMTNAVPGKNKLWVKSIIEVLSWPSERAPGPDEIIAPGRDWMPKGAKRLQLADDRVEGVPARRYIVETLNSHLP